MSTFPIPAALQIRRKILALLPRGAGPVVEARRRLERHLVALDPHFRWHPFERVGLGLFPFRVVGVREMRGPIELLDEKGRPTGFTSGAPGQPMGTCSYCHNGIAECWTLRGRDGREFVVGCDCVRRVDEEGLLADQMRPLAARRRRERDEAQRVVWKSRLESDPGLRERLRLKPSPNAARAARGETSLDWSVWMLDHAGASGRRKVIALLRRMAEPGVKEFHRA